jgi:protein-disulfide isomerase
MKSTHIVGLLAVVAVVAAIPLVGRAQQPKDDPQTLQKRIAALEAGQQAILKELQEIKALLQKAQQTPAATTAAAAASGSAASMPVPTTPISIQNAPSRGSASAHVTLIEFSDFECPFCGRYARETYAQIQKEYVDTGKVRYVFRNAPIEDLHPRAFGAAVAGECARAQNKFWELHDRMFRDQRGLTPVGLRSSADMVGIDLAAFDRCVAGEAAPAKVRQDLADAVAFGGTATPTFFLAVEEKNGTVRALQKIVGAKSFSVFKAALDTLLSSPAFKQ